LSDPGPRSDTEATGEAVDEREPSIELPDPPATVRAHLEQVATAWGAELEPEDWGGKLALPVVSGLRRGVAFGRVTISPLDGGEGGSRVVFRPEQVDLYLNVAAVAFLVLSLAGALLTVIWPIFPKLLPIAPLGALLALGGWFLVISRLRNSGPREFLETLAVVGAEARKAREEPETAAE
jgi:hypothetical protein